MALPPLPAGARSHGAKVPSVTPVKFQAGVGLDAVCDNLLAFYYPGSSEPCDVRCGAEFLGNFFGEGCIELDKDGKRCHFRTAEAAYQALKFWHRAEDFEDLSGQEAWQKSRALHWDGVTLASPTERIQGMLHILRQKFHRLSPLAERLKETKGCFLLEHNSSVGRDDFWSDNCDGKGKNLLGALLMLRRSELLAEDGEQDPWWEWASVRVNETGKTFPEWGSVVLKARNCIIEALRAAPAGPPALASAQDGVQPSRGWSTAAPKEVASPIGTGGSSASISGDLGVQWCWGEPRNATSDWTYQPYSPENSRIIEAAYQAGRAAVEIGVRGTSYRIDLKNMLQVNVAQSWKYSRPIQRQRAGPTTEASVPAVPQCRREGCSRPAFEGREGECCSKACRDLCGPGKSGGKGHGYAAATTATPKAQNFFGHGKSGGKGHGYAAAARRPGMPGLPRAPDFMGPRRGGDSTDGDEPDASGQHAASSTYATPSAPSTRGDAAKGQQPPARGQRTSGQHVGVQEKPGAQWFFGDHQKAQDWQPYDDQNNQIIERAFKDKQMSAAIDVNGKQYRVLFDKNVQVAAGSRGSRPVQREEGGASASRAARPDAAH